LSLALLLGGVNAGCLNFRPPPTPLTASVAGDAPTRVWTAKAGRRLTGRVEVRGNTLYAGGMDRKLYAIDLANGELRWSARLSGMLVGGVLAAGDTLFVATSRPDGHVMALNNAKGKRIWRASADPVAAPLALIGGNLVVQTQRGEVLALDPRTGKLRWRRRVGSARGPAIPAGPDAMLVSTTDSLFRLALSDGSVTHRSPSPGAVLAAWLPYKGTLVAGTSDSQVVAIRPQDLAAAWAVRVDAPVLGPPATLGDTLFLVTRLGSVYRIEPATEPQAERVAALKWAVTAPLSIAGGQILLGGADGIVRALKPEGSEIWRLRIWRPIELGPVPLSDGVLAIGGNGDLHRYRR
jgi:outer membrane protein assembly factor BamB